MRTTTLHEEIKNIRAETPETKVFCEMKMADVPAKYAGDLLHADDSNSHYFACKLYAMCKENCNGFLSLGRTQRKRAEMDMGGEW